MSQVIGYMKGKSAIHLARVYGERKRNFVGQHFWARGYFVSTVGRDEAVIRKYDHSYYFIATFIKDNLRSHAANIVYSGAEAERR